MSFSFMQIGQVVNLKKKKNYCKDFRFESIKLYGAQMVERSLSNNNNYNNKLGSIPSSSNFCRHDQIFIKPPLILSS